MTEWMYDVEAARNATTCAPDLLLCAKHRARPQLRISANCDRGAPVTLGVIELPRILAAQIQGGASDRKARVHREPALDADQCRPHRAPKRGTGRNNLVASLPITAQTPKVGESPDGFQ